MKEEYSDRLKVALVEFSPVWESRDENLVSLDRIFDGLFSGALPFSPELVVLPEFFAVGFTMNLFAAEQDFKSVTLEWMKEKSRQYGCAVAGSVPVMIDLGARFNRMFFVTPPDRTGNLTVSYYDKAHLFFGGEDDNYIEGVERRVFEFNGWRIMPGICFDLRFPEWARNFRKRPYDLYLNVANWPVARNAAADILLKARSIENVCWSVFCNRTGSDRLLEYSGNSAVIDYRGRSRGKRSFVDNVPVVYAELEKDPMMRFREGFPILDLI